MADAGNGRERRQGDGDGDDSVIPVSKLSCEQCRQRKVRCDRSHPCTPCTEKQISCTFPTGFKPRPRRQRAVVSDAFEEKIDGIARTLNRVQQTIEKLSIHSPSHQPLHARLATPAFTPVSQSSAAQETDDHGESELESAEEGETSLKAEAAFATDYVHALAGNSHLLHDISTSLDTLHRIVDSSRRSTAATLSSGGTQSRLNDPTPGNERVSLPPIELVMAYLQKAKKDSPRLKFFWNWDLISVGQSMEYLLPVYAGQASIPETIITHVGIFRLFKHYSNEEKQEQVKEQLRMQAQSCRQNVDMTLTRLPFNLPSTLDCVLALYQASNYCLEQCRLSMAWNLLSLAVQMCYTLGFNLETAHIPETDDAKRFRVRLFWFIVILESCLSLRLGRPSNIHENSLVVNRIDSFKNLTSTSASFPDSTKWIDWALLHGRIYTEIMSPVALLQSETTRASKARVLANELQSDFDGTIFAGKHYREAKRKAVGDEMAELLERANRVSHLATMTLIYRSIPANPYSHSAFSEECIATAHQTLEEHQRCLPVLRKMDAHVVEMYLQWALLSSPFTPFIVIFCRAVETSDRGHLDKLWSVVEALQLVQTSCLPEAYDKQLRLFKLMHEVASKFIESRQTITLDHETMPTQRIAADSSLEGTRTMQTDFSHDNSGDLMDIGSFIPHSSTQISGLGDWFDQNQMMMGLLEDDFKGYDDT